MLIQYGQALGDYLYDVFVAKFDFWLAFGLVRAIAVHRALPGAVDLERARRQSVVPMAFWFFSMGGGLMTLVYGIAKREPVIIIGQSLATIIYIRNIMLIVKNRGNGVEDAGPLTGSGRARICGVVSVNRVQRSTGTLQAVAIGQFQQFFGKTDPPSN